MISRSTSARRHATDAGAPSRRVGACLRALGGVVPTSERDAGKLEGRLVRHSAMGREPILSPDYEELRKLGVDTNSRKARYETRIRREVCQTRRGNTWRLAPP